MSKPGLALLKVSLSQSFDFRKKDKIKNVSMLVPIILIFIGGCLLASIYSFFFSFILLDSKNGEQLHKVLYAMAGIASLLGIVTGFTKVKGTLFGGNDYDMLASLPIPKRNIIFVKLFSLYLIQFFYTAIFVLPATGIVAFMGKQPLWLLDGLLLLILSPVFPLFIAGSLGILIGLISDRFRFGNVITVLFYIVFLMAIMYSSFLMNSGGGTEEYDIIGLLRLLSIMGWINPFSKLLTLEMIGVNQALYIASTLILLTGMIYLFARCYDYYHVLMTSTRTSIKYVQKMQKRRGQFKALFFLDVKRYFTSKMYLLNTITGGIMCILVTAIMFFSFKTVKDPEAMTIFKEIAPYMVLIVVWCVGMAVPSAVSINMEGKTMWQIKTLPISYKQYALSKVLLSYLVLAPFVLISSILLTIFTGFTLASAIVNFILPQVYILSMSLLGLLVNSYFYKLKWSNETEAVKNSSGMLISMVLDFAYTGILCVLLLVPGLLGFYLLGAIVAILFVIGMAILFYILVLKLSVSSIEHIEC
ncbi:MAG: hypothetical protein HFG91_00055 [Acholeplasmatales bacterium]|jgi:ABC-2 type transport system permease protein|nr:hypothetical protein [Acholeplasmatales bacterium]